MKIGETVYYVEDTTITKTRIIGIKEILSKQYGEEKEEITKTYLVQVGKKFAGASEDWVLKDDLHPTLESAKKEISDEIQREAVEKA